MPAKAQWNSVLPKIYLPIVIVGFASLWFSAALASLCTAVCGVLVLLQIKELVGHPFSRVIVPILFLIVLALADVVIGGGSVAVDKIVLILGFFFLLLSGYIWSQINPLYRLYGFLIICGIVVVINVLSVGNYLMHKAYYDEMLLQSKSIPIVDGMHHIHFGIINAITLIGLAGVILLHTTNREVTVLSSFLFILVIISFHILSSRTGLLSFYVAAVASIAAYSARSGSRKVLYISIVALPLLIISAYFFSSSFQNKVQNSIEDINSWGVDEEINYKSMAMRLEAYKVSSELLMNNPLGVGATKMDYEIQRTFEQNNSVLFKENRKGPHNQFLEYGVKYGWLGILILLYFFYELYKQSTGASFPLLGLVVLLFIAMQFESLLERQASLYTVGLFVPLFSFLFSKNETNGDLLTY